MSFADKLVYRASITASRRRLAEKLSVSRQPSANGSRHELP